MTTLLLTLLLQVSPTTTIRPIDPTVAVCVELVFVSESDELLKAFNEFRPQQGPQGAKKRVQVIQGNKQENLTFEKREDQPAPTQPVETK